MNATSCKISAVLKSVLFLFLICINCPAQDTNSISKSTPSRKTTPLLIHGLNQNFVRIPSGKFLMGSNERADEKPIHLVQVDSFDMAITEVTVKQFRAFVQATCYRTDAEIIGHSFACCWRPKIGINWRNPGFIQADDEPVVAVSWNDANAFCRWLSEETGEDYRLPSEAQWEYACLAVNSSEKYLALDSIAWYGENSEGHPHAVGTKHPSEWGLFDMKGNAWEWTQDIYHENYIGAPADGNPWTSGGSPAQRGYLKPGDGRVLRGGGWGLYIQMHPVSYDLRTTSRPVFGCDNSCNNSGFRVVRVIKDPIRNDCTKRKLTTSFEVSGIPFEMIGIPSGQYLMGSETNNRSTRPVHPVVFENPFLISRTEITIKQYGIFVESTGYITEAEQKGKCWDSDFRRQTISINKPGINWRDPGFVQGDEDPVTCITWNDAMAFCNWLSKQTGRNFRLPSEAEWEYACGAGSVSIDRDAYKQMAWYYENSNLHTHPVATKSPNSWGIHDMLGNVAEWTMDIWHPDYNGAPEDGSSWLGEPILSRVCRGGSFEREASEMGLHDRDWYDESEAVAGVGFRIVEGGINNH
jgi:formylglycine-generating enzyme required for sulfatase activity